MKQSPFQKSASAGAPPLLFLGTSHLDPKGYHRLTNALADTHPDIILLEVSRFSLLFRHTLGRIYRRFMESRIKEMEVGPSPELGNALRYLDVPPEYRAARDYCHRNGARLYLVDVSCFSFLHLIHAHGVISRKNIQTLSIIHADRFAGEKNIARRIFEGGDEVLAEMKARGFRQEGAQTLARFHGDSSRREIILAKRVMSSARKHAGKRIVYIGGWEHCIDDPKKRTLYSLIDAPKERRIVFLEYLIPGDNCSCRLVL